MKLAFVFPGQGSQVVGMGRAFFESEPVARAVFDEADEALAAARAKTFAQLRAGVQTVGDGSASEDAGAAVVAAWALVHGIATLGLTGNLDASDLRALFADADLPAITRRSAAFLYGSPPRDER